MLKSRTRRTWTALAAAEVVLAAGVVLLDLLLPALVLLALMTVSLLVRREGLASLGLRRVRGGRVLAAKMLLFSAAWTLFHLGVLIPVANRLTGEQQDMSDFAALEGDLGMLALLLVLTWTLAAVGEELAFRGYLQTRLTEVLGGRGPGLVVSVVVSSLMFGMLHTEQGLVGLLLTTVDGIAFCVLRYRFATLWASILAHGFNNTIGFVAFYFLGPVYGLW
jgi:membrane protease YdiL (CAAX protease family)